MEVMMKTKLFLAAALVSALPATAFAQSANESPRIAVSYRDLDLASEAGRQALETRIRGAVRRVCGRLVSGSVRELADGQRCRRQTSAVANSQVRLAIARASLSGAALAAQ
jgi:UrcA family protein